ncbi:Hypothetical protein CINCED_3A011896 [Cinara cedri]|uniref:Uncharacterized protein n=1 Tax=Cinara cedri TaxID=506608 RepID=A0A5E4MT86_9HEMI|nr:Hypothetical protein CINCED_3A011896 [Cinara cedri]
MRAVFNEPDIAEGVFKSRRISRVGHVRWKPDKKRPRQQAGKISISSSSLIGTGTQRGTMDRQSLSQENKRANTADGWFKKKVGREAIKNNSVYIGTHQ